MELILQREFDNHESTTGIIYVDGIPYCATIEDTYRHDKLLHETRIPAGRYPIKMRHGSPMAERYYAKHGTEGMMHMIGVPEFTYVYIHIGNDEDDSSGCALVGEKIVKRIEGGKIHQSLENSTDAYLMLHHIVDAALKTGDDVFVTVIDN